MKTKQALIAIIVSIVFINSAQANHNGVHNNSDISAQSSWSVTASVGQVRVNNSAQPLPNDNDINKISVDKVSRSWSAGVFYSVNENWKLGIKYIDLGEGEQVFSVATINPSETHQQYSRVAPLFATGVALEAAYQHQFNNSLSVKVFAGIFRHKLEVNSYATNQSTITSTEYDNQPYTGLGLGYQINDNIDLLLQYSYFDLDAAPVNDLSIGVSYRF